ncbi:hypothetical protein SteCoe_9992 [Stentor coeruleus]|uniref:Protein kinase domain-containing protein n=1 Tax=Stentor coeruleus TaxID=5963 RepID=A0A1R2CGH2_9CILI|nr:hypothetical protein SteCoe_9992 [Stentor coeruleus]
MNILIKSPDEIKIIDFVISFECIKKYEGSAFHNFTPSKYASELYLSPELMTQRRMHNTILSILYDSFKSDVFSLGLSILSACGIDVTNLNCFGQNYDEFIRSMITVSYECTDDSLKTTYKLIREELQKTIDERINEFRYYFLNDTLSIMLEVNILERATIDEIYKDAKYFVGIIEYY